MAKKHKIIKCVACRSNIDVTDKVEIGDADIEEHRDGTKTTYVYCDKCGHQHEV
jgi:uncharacterized protein with PIN domain